MSTILEGKTIRDSIKNDLKEKIEKRIASGEIPPTLAIIQVGNNPASNAYIKRKIDFGHSIGAQVIHKKFPETISQDELLKEIDFINVDPTIHGAIVQLPLPDTINPKAITEAIDPKKDADGLHSKNRSRFLPATTRGVFALLSHYKVQIEGRKVLIVGRSELVGIPTALAFIKRNATVTVAHSKTTDLKAECLQADIIVSAVGNPGLISKEMVKKGQIIIDVGIVEVNGKLVGDVEFDGVKEIVEAVTPVPGGVGPLTVASLFQNLIDLL